MQEKVRLMFDLFFELVANENTNTLISKISESEDGAVISGVGKNWYVAEKVAKTYLSMGIRCATIDPVHALHGDIGLIKNQIIIVTSKSGNTEELVTFVKYIRFMRNLGKINPYLVGVILNKDGAIVDLLDLSICPLKYKIFEFDQKDLVPSLSINIIQMLLDYIGVMVFEQNPTLLEKYKYNHPGGEIGTRTKIGELLDK